MSNIQVHTISEPIASVMRGGQSEEQDFSDTLMARHDKMALSAHFAAGDGNGSSRKPNGGVAPPTSDRPQSKNLSALPSGDGKTIGYSDLQNLELGLVTNRLFSESPDALWGLPTASIDRVVAWSRVFGQHLIANDYLSVVEVVEYNQSESEISLGTSESPKAALMPDGGFSIISPIEAQGRGAAPQAGALPVAHVAKSSDSDPGNAGVVHDVSSAGLENALALDRLWAKRVLKLTRDSAEGCTAWVRDFDLREGEVQALATSLKRHASTQGVPLNRIMVNGREIWRAIERENS